MQETLVAMDQQDSGVTARLHSFIEGKTPVGKWVQYFTIVLIVFNVVCFLLSTDEAIDKNWHRTFFIVELVSTGIFTLEYLLRFYSVVETIDGEVRRPGRRRPFGVDGSHYPGTGMQFGLVAD